MDLLKHNRVYMFLVAGSMVFFSQYEVQLSSLVTVAQKPMAFETVDELHATGYRIGYVGNCNRKNIPIDKVCVGKRSSVNYELNYVTRKATWKLQGYPPTDIIKGIERYLRKLTKNMNASESCKKKMRKLSFLWLTQLVGTGLWRH